MPRSSLRDRLLAALTARLPYKAAALFFALVLWVIVSGEEPSEQVVAVRFVPVVEPGVRVLGEPPQMHAVAVGRARELLKLYAVPPTVRRVFTGDVPDSVAIEVRPGDVEVADGVAVRIGAVRPRRFVLRFETTLARRLPVRSALRVAGAGSVSFEPESVTVSGPRAVVGRLDAVRTVAIEVDPGATASTDVRLDVEGLGVRVSPSRVRALVTPTVVDPAAAAAPLVSPPPLPPIPIVPPGTVRLDSARAGDALEGDSALARPDSAVRPARSRASDARRVAVPEARP